VSGGDSRLGTSHDEERYLAPEWDLWQPAHSTRDLPTVLFGLDRQARMQLRLRVVDAARGTMQQYAAIAAAAGLDSSSLERAAGSVTLAPTSTLILTGHQPAIFHPGLTFKYQVTAQWAQERGAQAVAIMLDTDAGSAGSFQMPQAAQREGQADGSKLEAIVGIQSSSFAHAAELYGGSRLRNESELREQIARCVTSLRQCGLELAAQTFAQNADHYRRLANHPAMVANTIVRHVAGITKGLVELPMSTLCQFPEMQEVWKFLADDAIRLHQRYNQRLDAWREDRNIRNPANPFPNLRREGDRFEMPLWFYDPATQSRSTVWARQHQNVIQLMVDQQTMSIWDTSRSHESWPTDVRLVPRGALVSLIFRVLASDLFVHGRGGEIYDQFTDELIRDYVGIEPPRFVVASATRYLFPKRRQQLLQLDQLAEQKRELTYHPEKYLTDDKFSESTRKQLQSLCDEKQRLVTRLQSKRQAGESAADEGRRLQQIQGELKTLVEREFAAPLEQHGGVTEAARIAIEGRTYPWFCFAHPSN
jgi:hypothetical protein